MGGYARSPVIFDILKEFMIVVSGGYSKPGSSGSPLKSVGFGLLPDRFSIPSDLLTALAPYWMSSRILFTILFYFCFPFLPFPNTKAGSEPVGL